MTSKLAFWRRKASVLSLLLASSIGCAGAYASDFNVAHGQLMTGAHVPTAVATGLAPRMGMLPAEKRLQLSLNLPVRNAGSARRPARSIAGPEQSELPQDLSVDEYTECFGPTQADYDEVVSWAKSNGFNVTETAPNRRLVNVEGAVSTINKALHVDDEFVRASVRKPQLLRGRPRTAGQHRRAAVHINGLDNFQLPFNHLKSNGAAHTGAVVSHAGGSGPSGEFLPSDMRAAYYGSGSLTGSGQSIGIFSFDG